MKTYTFRGTPGEWKPKTIQDARHVFAGKVAVAMIYDNHDTDSIADANVRAIAAVPELIESLILTRDWIGSPRRTALGTEAMLDIIDAALAKAT